MPVGKAQQSTLPIPLIPLHSCCNGTSPRERCRTWQPSSPAPIRATDPAPPATEVPFTVEASPLVSASTGTAVPVEVEATAGAPASPQAVPSGVGGGVGLGW